MKSQKLNILIIEDKSDDAETIFTNLATDSELNILPQKNGSIDMQLMYSLINRCNEFVDEVIENEREQKEQKLITFFDTKVSRKDSLDIIILDVALHPNNIAHEINGAKIRPLLYKLYPKAKVVFCTTKAKDENFREFIYRDDIVIFKDAYGTTSFGAHFIKEFNSFLKQNKMNVIKSTSTEKKEENKLMFWVAFKNKEYRVLASLIGQFILSAFVFFAIIVFLIGTFKYLIDFVDTMFQNEKSQEKLISKLLHILEMFFIIPLPMIIITSFIIFCKKVISKHLFSKLGYGSEGIETDSKYYIGISKALFVSTLVSVLSINLLEISIKILYPLAEDGLKKIAWQEISILALTVITLFASYFSIERSIHHIINIIKEKGKNEG